MTSNNKTENSQKKSLPVLQFTDNPVVILSDKICSQINYLHKKVGKSEWSGILLYSHKEGDISDADNLIIVAEEIYLMDIGTSAATNYTNDVDSILDLFDKYPKLESNEWKMGHVHTHHDLGGTSFSGVDMSELQQNTENYNYYLSLIVDFTCKPTAKISTICKVHPTKIIHPGAIESVEKQTQPEERLGVYECIVSNNLDQNFSDRFSLVKKQKEEEEKRKAAARAKKPQWAPQSQVSGRRDPMIPETYNGIGFGRNSGRYFDNDFAGPYEGDPHYAQQDMFIDHDFSEEAVASFVYRWLTMDLTNNKGTIEEALDDINIWINDVNPQMYALYAEQLMDNFDDYVIDVFGNGNQLTDDEYYKLVGICIDLLEAYGEQPFIEVLISNLNDHYEMLEEEFE